MDKNHESTNKPNLAKGVFYGAASLTQILHGIYFPVTKEEIIHKYGDKEVNYSKGNIKKMKDIISKCTKETFFSMSELIEACARKTYWFT